MANHVIRPYDAGPVPYHRLMRTEGYQWWRPVFGSLVIFAGWIIATMIAVIPVVAVWPETEGKVSWATLLATNVSLAALVPICMVVYSRLHQLPAGLLGSVQLGLRWRPLLMFAGLAFAAELALLVVAVLAPVEFVGEQSGPASDAAALIAVTLLTSCFQAAGEEYLFRGYLMQAFGAMVRGPWFAVGCTSVLFTMAHGVWPWESPALFADRFAFGVIAGLLVLRTGGLEAGIAMHAANNVVTFVFAALTDSVSDSLKPQDAPVSLVLVDVVKFAVFGLLALWLARRQRLVAEADPAVQIPPRVMPPGLGPGAAPGHGVA
jgi:membrane protease YdiL (CAAX protease family)